MEIVTTFNVFKNISGSNKVYYCKNLKQKELDTDLDEVSSYYVYFGKSPNIYKSIVSSEDDIISFNNLKNDYIECLTEGDAIALSYNEISLIKDTDGRSVQVVEPRVGKEVIYTTHNFCDPCTWYCDSIRVTDEILTSNDLTEYSSNNPNWIDMISGRIQDDDGISEEHKILNPEDPHGYLVIVKVNDVVKVARESFEDSGGDYTINFENGKITFFNTLNQNDVVKCSYSYSTTSTFYLKALPNTKLDIEGAESDFTSDVVMSDGIEYSIWATNPEDPETKIKIKSTKYKRMSNLTQEAIGVFPVLNAIGASNSDKLLGINEFRYASRGMKNNIQSIPFKYSTIRALDFLYGVEVRIKTIHDRPLTGESATLTFYCTSK